MDIDDVSPSYVHIYDKHAAVVNIRQCIGTTRN